MLKPKMSPLARKKIAEKALPVVKEEVAPVEEEVVEEDGSEDSEEDTPKTVSPLVKGKAGALKPAVKINILAMKAAAEKRADTPDTICLLLVGPRQAGKSTTLGTVSGTMMLFTTSDEAHSIETAMAKSDVTYGATIIPCHIDMQTEDAAGNPLPEDMWSALSADQAISKLNTHLDALIAEEKLSNVLQWVALDSIYSIFKKINDKKNIQLIKAGKGNNFRAQEVALKELLDLNQKLVMLQKKGINVVVTCPAAAEQDKTTGLYSQIEVLLEGFRNNLHVVGIFPDITTVGYASFETDGGEIQSDYYFMFNGELNKAGKKVTGEERCVNFKPRINGILLEETPDALPADLTILAQYKAQVKAARKSKETEE